MIKISIIVPVFNMIDTIEQTLSSIWNQNYENLELIVMDGDSSDGTKEFLNFHKSKIDIFISEKDKGQYHAIQKGMDLATGEVVSWLNADDIYFSWTLNRVNLFFQYFEKINWIAGLPSFLDNTGNITHIYNNLSARPQNFIRYGAFRNNVFGYLQQESMFFRKSLWDKVGGLDLNYNLAADFELWTRFAQISSIVSVNIPLSGFRIDDNSRSKKHVRIYEEEVNEIVNRSDKRYSLIQLFSKFNLINKFIRLITYRKQKVIFYSITKRKWICKSFILPMSTVSFSYLKLEVL